MTDLLPATVAIARALTVGAPVFVVGAPAPRDGWVAVGVDVAETRVRDESSLGGALVIAECADRDTPPLAPAARDRLLRRAPAWGLAPIWVGDADLPPAGMAVCIECAHPEATVAALAVAADLLSGDVDAIAPDVTECTDEVCITCSDEGRIAEVVRVPEGLFLPATVRTATGVEEVDVTLVGDVAPHDLLLVHAGGAIARLSEPVTEAVR